MKLLATSYTTFCLSSMYYSAFSEALDVIVLSIMSVSLLGAVIGFIKMD